MRPPLFNKVMGRTFFDIVAFKGRLIFMPIWGELFSRRLFEWDQIAFSLPNKNEKKTSNWLNYSGQAVKKHLSPGFQTVKYHRSPRSKLRYSSLEQLPI